MRFSLAILPFLAAIASAYPADINAPVDGHVAISHETQLKNIIRNDTSTSGLGHPPVSEISGIPHHSAMRKCETHTNLIFDSDPDCVRDSEAAITAEQGA